MKKIILIYLFYILNSSFTFGQEYNFYYSGDNTGFITIKKDSSGKITITPGMREIKTFILIDNEMCSLLPEDNPFYLFSYDMPHLITIEGNTTTYSDGRWYRKVIEGNTTTTTSSDGTWNRKVIDKQGYNIYITEESVEK